MNLRFWVILAMSVSVLFPVPQALVAGANCGAVLQQDVQQLDFNQSKTYASLESTMQSVQKDSRKSGDLAAVINGAPVKLSFAAANNLARQFFDVTQVNWTESTKVSYLSTALGKEAAEAYKACIKSGQSGAQIVAYEIENGDAVAVSIRWLAPFGGPQSIKAGDIKVYNGSDLVKNTGFEGPWTFNQVKETVIPRQRNKDVTILAALPGGSDEVTVKYVPRIKIERKAVPVTEPTNGELEFRTDASGHMIQEKRCVMPTDDHSFVEDAVFEFRFDPGTWGRGGYKQSEPVSPTDRGACFEITLDPPAGASVLHYKIHYFLTEYVLTVR